MEKIKKENNSENSCQLTLLPIYHLNSDQLQSPPRIPKASFSNNMIITRILGLVRFAHRNACFTPRILFSSSVYVFWQTCVTYKFIWIIKMGQKVFYFNFQSQFTYYNYILMIHYSIFSFNHVDLHGFISFLGILSLIFSYSQIWLLRRFFQSFPFSFCFP